MDNSKSSEDRFEKVVFYREWLPLPKDQFLILAMTAAHRGCFKGTYADMCRYINVTPQTRNREKLKLAIETLVSGGFISRTITGRIHEIKPIPKEEEIRIPLLLVQSILRHDYSTEAVAAVQVLKTLLWITRNKADIITNKMIARDLKISESTVVNAKNVLEREYETITKQRISEKVSDDFFITLGQRLQASAWWNDI